MPAPCCRHRARRGSCRNCSVMRISMRAPLESRIRSISRTCAGPNGEEGRGSGTQQSSPAPLYPPSQHLAEHGAQLLAGAIIAAVGKQLLHLLLDLLLVQVPAVGVLDARARRGVWGTCGEGGTAEAGAGGRGCLSSSPSNHPNHPRIPSIPPENPSIHPPIILPQTSPTHPFKPLNHPSTPPCHAMHLSIHTS